ncbi:LutC/YkgG family protein [Segatella buccae]|uniref:LutC/YkgG family protein n=1 Tax=Segatella buccae TaxID=28126 RepID=UPI0027BA7D6E|nr:LUD domain-containing protein [Segatella buccae]
MKKEDLFATLRANTYMQYDMPEMGIDGITYPDCLRQFVEMTESVGGHVLELGEGEDLNDAVRRAYPDARVFASHLPEITIAGKNPDTVAAAADLNGTDVGIVRGELGVAENGCVWVPQTMKEKAVCFISEYLVIVLKKTAIVDNMHEAYARIDMDPRYNFGTFISGPSKTADIEQSLVMGAQAARGVTVILV